VDADKGFNFSPQDDSFVCQKKNHFQVTLHVTVEGCPKFVRLPDGGAAQIHGFYVTFHGIKVATESIYLLNCHQLLSEILSIQGYSWEANYIIMYLTDLHHFEDRYTIRVGMISAIFFTRSFKGRCYGNRFLARIGDNWQTGLHSVL